MHIKVVNRQTINASVEKTLEAILDCEKWPTFIPTVKKIEFLEKNGYYAKRILHSEINGILAKMVTETQYNPLENKIEYNQIETPWPLISNKGVWIVKKTSDKEVELLLTHVFKVKYSIFGYLFGLLIIGPFFIHAHNRKDLRLYKKFIEENV